MIYLTADMLSEVDESIKALGLKDAAELVGRIPHDAVEDLGLDLLGLTGKEPPS
jgi:hypothetical protein